MRKNIFRTLLAAALMSLCFSVTAFAETAVVTGSEVNLRSGPGTNYRIINCLSSGSSVTVTDRSNDSWYAVNYGSQSGFISAAYLSLSSSDPFAGTPIIGNQVNPGQSTQISQGSSGYINAMYVRFRSGPTNSASILGEYNRGKALTITGTSGDWTACTIDGQAGYVFSQYVSAGTYSGSGEIFAEEDIFLSDFPDGNSMLENPSGTPVYPDNGGSQLPPLVDSGTVNPSPSPTSTPVTVPSASPAQEQAGYINGDTVRSLRSRPAT